MIKQNEYPKVLYDVSSTDFRILDDDHIYQMNSQINRSNSASYRQIYWSTVAESGLITQQVSLYVSIKKENQNSMYLFN